MTLTSVPTASRSSADVSTAEALEVLPLRPRPPIEAVDATVVDNRPLRDRYWRLRLAARSLAAARPGQFAMVTVTRDPARGPVLPRPMAIYDVDQTAGHADIVYSVVGEGTLRLTEFIPGEPIGVVGPLGRGFDVPTTGGGVLLLGRGIGTCSLTLLAKEAAHADLRVTAVASGRHRAAVIGGEVYRAAGADVLQVDDVTGSSHVDRLWRRLVGDFDVQRPSLVATCGSARLGRLAGELARRWATEAQVSIEAHMACGLGYCHGCSTAATDKGVEAPLVCRDGPVFRLQAGSSEYPHRPTTWRCP